MFTATVIQVFFDERFKHAPEVKQFYYGAFTSYHEADLYAHQRIAFLYFELIAKAARFEPKLVEVVDNFNNLPALKKALNDIKCHEYTYTASIVPENQPVVEITRNHVDSLRTQLGEIINYSKLNMFPPNLEAFFSDDIVAAEDRGCHHRL